MTDTFSRAISGIKLSPHFVQLGLFSKRPPCQDPKGRGNSQRIRKKEASRGPMKQREEILFAMSSSTTPRYRGINNSNTTDTNRRGIISSSSSDAIVQNIHDCDSGSINPTSASSRDDGLSENASLLSSEDNKKRKPTWIERWRRHLGGRDQSLLGKLCCYCWKIMVCSTFLPRRGMPLWKKIICILFLVLDGTFLLDVYDDAFTSYGTPSMHHEEPNNPSASSASESNEDMTKYFSVVINTSGQPEILHHSVSHYAKECGRNFGVWEVFVVWTEHIDPPDTEVWLEDEKLDDSDWNTMVRKGLRNSQNLLQSHQSSKDKNNHPSKVTILRSWRNSPNSRFLPIPNLSTDAIFVVDDDVRVDCSDLSHGFDAWKSNSEVMVGYFPRLVKPFVPSSHSSAKLSMPSSLREKHNPKNMRALPWNAVYLNNQFNMILTKASFLHSKYLEMYSNPNIHPKRVLEIVDQLENCEDVAMAMLVANQTRQDQYNNNKDQCAGQPIYVEGLAVDLSLLGRKANSMAKQSVCLSKISVIYDNLGWGNPFLSMNDAVDDGSSSLSVTNYQYAKLSDCSWRRHAPGFWFQMGPSNILEWFSFENVFA